MAGLPWEKDSFANFMSNYKSLSSNFVKNPVDGLRFFTYCPEEVPAQVSIKSHPFYHGLLNF